MLDAYPVAGYALGRNIAGDGTSTPMAFITTMMTTTETMMATTMHIARWDGFRAS